MAEPTFTVEVAVGDHYSGKTDLTLEAATALLVEEMKAGSARRLRLTRREAGVGVTRVDICKKDGRWDFKASHHDESCTA